MTARSPSSTDERHGLRASLFLLGILVTFFGSCDHSFGEDPVRPGTRGDFLLIVGSPGEPVYESQFNSWADDWKQVVIQGGLHFRQIGPAPTSDPSGTLTEIDSALKELSTGKERPLWIVLIGHGTFDGRTAKFNLPGPDLEPAQLAKWLNPIQRPIAIVNCFSCSAPFLPALSKPGRVVITSTMNGNEVNFSRFGGELVKAISSPDADLDKDGQVSLLEAFLKAATATEEFYAGDGRLATEHAVLDDNGDGRSVPLAGFDGLRAKNRTDSGASLPDGLRAHQWNVIVNPADLALSPEVLARRNELEIQIFELTQRKLEFSPVEYDSRLEELLLELAALILPNPARDPPPAGDTSPERTEK